MPVPSVEVALLGGFRLSVDDRPVILTPAPQRLIALLALESRPVLRHYAAGQLWPDLPDDRALGNLRSALWRLRRQCLDIVLTEAGQLRLAPSVSADVPEAIDIATRLVQMNTDCPESELKTARFRRELLPDWYDDWLFLERERLRQLFLHALEAIAKRRIKLGHYPEAIDAALVAIASEPFRESAHRILIHAHLEEGNRSEAARQYTRYRELLARELGCSPSPELQELAAPFLSS